MGLNKYKLGNLIIQRREKNQNYDVPILGVSKEGFIPPKQKVADTSLYNVFYRNDFVFNPARMELNSIALNDVCDMGICSSLYEIFYVKDVNVILPEFLNLFVKRNEFARQCEFLGSGSAREYCRVGNISEIELLVPDISIQRKFVNLYSALRDNHASLLRGIKQMDYTCEVLMDDVKKRFDWISLEPYLERVTQKNDDGISRRFIGVSKEGFVTPRQSRPDDSLSKCTVVHYHDFVYNASRINIGSVMFSSTEEEMFCSEEYEVFHITDETKLLPEYLQLWLKRPECGRYLTFMTMDSVRNRVYLEDLRKISIPIPDIDVQKSIAAIYQSSAQRKEMANRLQAQLTNICPILIRGAIEEGAR